MVYDWMSEFISKGKLLQNIDNKDLDKDDIFIKKFYICSGGCKVPANEVEKYKKISTNVHNITSVKSDNDKFEEDIKTLIEDLTIYKKRYEAVVKYINKQVNMYNSKIQNHFDNTYNEIVMNTYKRMQIRIACIEKDLKLAKERKDE